MNTELVKKIADAVLYEGYMLYPYRASAVKNRQRFNWGVLAPQSYSRAQRGTENWQMQTEVIVSGNENTLIDLKIRFLHLCEREIYQVDEETSELCAVETLEVEGQIFQTWQEAVEREVELCGLRPDEITKESPETFNFSFPASQKLESLCDAGKRTVGAIVRKQQAVEGAVEVQSSELRVESSGFVRKLTVRVSNLTRFENPEEKSRDEALAHSLVSAHTILSVTEGAFVSLLEPSEEFAEAVAGCQNTGTYPVLVGEPGERDCFLSSPIILYDYPQIAPESAGDLFDGAEIDEILTLRIMTMTDEEKREMRNVDERARKMLERTENLSPEQLMNMHGILRQPRALEEKSPTGSAAANS